jgi:PKD repeat protein
MRAIIICLLLLSFVNIYSQPSIQFNEPHAPGVVGVLLPNDKLINTIGNIITSYYIGLQVDGSNNITTTSRTFNIDVTGLPLTSNTSVDVFIFSQFTNGNINTIIHKGKYTTTLDALSITLDAATLNFSGNRIQDHTGLYNIQINLPSGSQILFGNDYLVIEKTKDISIPGVNNSDMIFQLHFIDDYFIGRPAGSMNTYINEVQNSLLDSWQKEIVDYDLLHDLSPRLPLDANHIFDVFLAQGNNASIIPGQFHNAISPASSSEVDYKRNIVIDCDIIKNMGSLPETVYTEEELIFMTIAHEFFHGLQWSLMSANKIFSAFPGKYDLELKNRQWLYEGQAKFLETVFMQSHSRPGITNIVFSKLTNSESYTAKCADFINQALDKTYAFKSLKTLSYENTLFWRHTYEHNYAASVTDADRLAFLRETCKAYDAANSSDLSVIKTFMDAQFQAVSTPVFHSFKEALTDLAEKTYFRSNVWKDNAGNLLNYWNDPNGNNFYSAITSYTPPAENVVSATNVVPEITSSLDKSYAFRPYVYKFTNAGRYKFTFNSDPDNDLINATLYSKAYIIENDIINYSKEFVLTSGVGSLDDICIKNPNQKLVIIVTRYDPDEATINEDFKISGTILSSTLASKFDANIDYTVSPLTVGFTDQSTGKPLTWNWNLGEGTGSSLQNPRHEYTKSGKFTVALTTDNCASTNTLSKTNYISVLPPYINNVVFSQMGNRIYEYKRTFNSSTQKFEFTGIGGSVASDRDLVITVTTSLPLVYLDLEIDDENGKKCPNSPKRILKTAQVDTKIWTYTIQANSADIGPRLNNFKFSGIDYMSQSLVNSKIPASAPVLIDKTGTGVASSENTGVDDNFFVYVNSPLTPTDLLTQLILNNCNEHRVIIANNDSKEYTIDFNDGSAIVTLAPQSFIDHSFDLSKSEINIKVYQNNSLVKTFTGSFVSKP